MTLKKLAAAQSREQRFLIPQERWEYLEDPTYQLSHGTMVCMTCNKFNYSNTATRLSLLYCDFHKKLIYHGEHLTHSCELYQNKATFNILKRLNNQTKVA